MKKIKLKRFVVPTIYLLTIFVFGSSMYLIQKVVNNHRFETNSNTEYVDSEIVTDTEYIPVVSETNTLIKPYLDELVKVKYSFYNSSSDTTNQEQSIIYYENTYMQNSGTAYTNENVFDIISILDGTVIEVSDNELLGKTIKIQHSNDLISTYQSLSEINVKKDDTVLRGQVIAKSGTSKIYSENNNLHFELTYQGQNIDPETSYNKTISELQA